jgi:hypothetical protein
LAAAASLSALALANFTSRVARALAARSVWTEGSDLPIASSLLVVWALGTFFSFFLPFFFFTREDEDGWSDLDVAWILDTTMAISSLVVLDCGLGIFFSFSLSLIFVVPEDEGDEDGGSISDIGWVVDTLVVDSLIAPDWGLGTFSFPLSLILLVRDDEEDEDGWSDLVVRWGVEIMTVDSFVVLDWGLGTFVSASSVLFLPDVEDEAVCVCSIWAAGGLEETIFIVCLTFALPGDDSAARTVWDGGTFTNADEGGGWITKVEEKKLRRRLTSPGAFLGSGMMVISEDMTMAIGVARW